MIIRFWGVRGSIPVVDARMLRYGGNTSCVSVEIDDRVLVFDAGTGIRALGHSLRTDGRAVFLLLSHIHWDHVQGFPFFEPLFEPGRVIYLFEYGDAHWTPLALLDGRHFPIAARYLPADVRCVAGPPAAFFAESEMALSQIQLNHPGGSVGYRVDHRGISMAYLVDNELSPPVATTPFRDFVSFCKGADVLCHDAQYVKEDLPRKRGWGHSQVDEVCRLAIEAGVGHLVLHHHDPDRTDEAVDAVQAAARGVLAPHGIRCTAAYEGLYLDLPG